MATEEERAIAYRASARRRVAAERQRVALLAGNPALHRALIANWQPLIDYLRERQTNGDQEAG